MAKASSPKTVTRKCMVVMPFANDFDEIYHSVFVPACRTQQVECRRVDERAIPGSITGDIVNGIMDADLVLADLTGQNANVFYELGIAHALNKHVITVCQSVDDVPFDLRSYRVLTYSKTFAGAARLREDLERVIAELLATNHPPSNPVQDAMQLRSDRKSPHAVSQATTSGASSSRLVAQTREVVHDRAVAKIMTDLKRISAPRSKFDSVLLRPPERESVYIHLHCVRRDKQMVGMAASNRELAKSDRLSREQTRKMEELGWEPPDADVPSYYRLWPVEDEHHIKLIALETVRTFSDVYQVEALDTLAVELS
jgi:hypothetical protein